MVGWVRSNAVVSSADAHLAALVRADQGYQPEPDRISEGLEHLRQPGGRGLADRLADQRGAGLDHGLRLGRGGQLQAWSGEPASTSLYLDGVLFSLASWPRCIDACRWRAGDDG